VSDTHQRRTTNAVGRREIGKLIFCARAAHFARCGKNLDSSHRHCGVHSVWVEVRSTIDRPWTVVPIPIVGGNLTAGLSEKQEYAVRRVIPLGWWSSRI